MAKMNPGPTSETPMSCTGLFMQFLILLRVDQPQRQYVYRPYKATVVYI